MSQFHAIDRRAGNLIARTFVANSATVPEADRTKAFRLLALITEGAESEQLLIAAVAIEHAAEAQMQLFEVLEIKP